MDVSACSRVHLDLVPNGCICLFKFRSSTKWMLIEIFYQPMQQLLAAVVVVGVVAADFPGLLMLALVEVEVIPCTD